MESDDIKVCKMQVRKVAQDIMMLVLHKQGFILEKPTAELSFVPEITAEFLVDLYVLVSIEMFENGYLWGDFLIKHFKPMTKTPYQFAKYFAYASYISIEKATDSHACFINILSLVTHFALHCWEKDGRFLNSCVDLFCAFFDKELCMKFEDQGRWRNFKEYLQNQGNLKRYKELIRANKPPNEIFDELQSKHLEFESSRIPYIINDIVLKDVTENEVENHEKATNFANLVKDQMKEVCNKTLQEVLKGFPKTDNQVEELYRETVGVASDGRACDEDQASSQEVQEDALENSSKNSPEKIEDRTKEVKDSGLLVTPVAGSLKSRGSNPAHQESDPSPKLSKTKRAKALLEEMMKDIGTIGELIKFVCE